MDWLLYTMILVKDLIPFGTHTKMPTSHYLIQIPLNLCIPFGQSFASGDLDGDGNTDFIVGGKSIVTGSNNEEGGAYVYYGPLMGSYDSAHAFISGELAATNDKDYARLGSAVSHYSRQWYKSNYLG